jgi:hypothetical protein
VAGAARGRAAGHPGAGADGSVRLPSDWLFHPALSYARGGVLVRLGTPILATWQFLKSPPPFAYWGSVNYSSRHSRACLRRKCPGGPGRPEFWSALPAPLHLVVESLLR